MQSTDVFKEEPFLFVDSIVVQDFAEFRSTDVWDVSKRMLEYQTDRTTIYPYLMDGWNLSGIALKLDKFIPQIMTRLKSHDGSASNTFADVGAGVGVLAQIMAEWGDKQSWYFGLNADAVEFCKWRVSKQNIPMSVHRLYIDQFTFPRSFSTMVVDSLLEQLPATHHKSALKNIAHALEVDGLLVLVNDAGRGDINLPELHHHLQSCGLTCTYGLHNFASTWTKKMPMTKQFSMFGIAARPYESSTEAAGFTYITNTGALTPTPFFWDGNPFNNEIRSSKNILELGCGVGRNLPILMQNTTAHYWGIEPNPDMLKYFWDVSDHQYKDRVTLVASIDELPDDVRFDVVISTFVMQHIAYMTPANVMNVTDITLELMKHTTDGTVWFVLEHERENAGWQERWMTECNIVPDVHIIPAGGPSGGGTLPYPEFESMTHRGNDNNIIIFKERK